jgi:hypothetical protein
MGPSGRTVLANACINRIFTRRPDVPVVALVPTELYTVPAAVTSTRDAYLRKHVSFSSVSVRALRFSKDIFIGCPTWIAKQTMAGLNAPEEHAPYANLSFETVLEIADRRQGGSERDAAPQPVPEHAWL